MFFKRKKRGFRRVSECPEAIIPERATALSAGYDLCCGEAFKIAPGEERMVRTGIKAYMLKDEYLKVQLRFSMTKRKLIMTGSGIIDADYYDNSTNEGEIHLAVKNHGVKPQFFLQGERIAQGIFHKYLLVDGDSFEGRPRIGGCGSTGRR